VLIQHNLKPDQQPQHILTLAPLNMPAHQPKPPNLNPHPNPVPLLLNPLNPLKTLTGLFHPLPKSPLKPTPHHLPPRQGKPPSIPKKQPHHRTLLPGERL